MHGLSVRFPESYGFRMDHDVVLIDGVCHLCNGLVRFIAARDPAGRFRFASLQSPAGRELAQGAGLAPGELSTVVLIERANGSDPRASIRSTAVLRILAGLRFPWPVLSLARIVPPFVRDPLYRWIARNRYRWFGRADVCSLPDPGLAGRFLENGVGDVSDSA